LGELQEGFDASLGRLWALSADDPCIGQVQGGKLELAVPAWQVGHCALHARQGYALSGQSLTVAFDALPAASSGARVRLELSDASGDTLRMDHEDGELRAYATVGADQSEGTTPLEAGPAWWRIRDTADRLLFELSTDGSSFRRVAEEFSRDLPPVVTLLVELQVDEAPEEDARVVVDAIN
jgi:hypothetical protein